MTGRKLNVDPQVKRAGINLGASTLFIPTFNNAHFEFCLHICAINPLSSGSITQMCRRNSYVVRTEEPDKALTEAKEAPQETKSVDEVQKLSAETSDVMQTIKIVTSDATKSKDGPD